MSVRAITVSQLKAEAADLNVENELVVTQNGIPRYSVLSYEDRQRELESMALLKMVSLAESDIKHGRTMSGEEMMARLRREKQV